MAQPSEDDSFVEDHTATWIAKQQQFYAAQRESGDDAADQPAGAATPAATGRAVIFNSAPRPPTTLGSMKCFEQTVNAAEVLSTERKSIDLTRKVAKAASTVAKANETLADHKEYLFQKTEITLDDKQKLERLIKSQERAHFCFKRAETNLSRHQSANAQAGQDVSLKRSIDVVDGAAEGGDTNRAAVQWSKVWRAQRTTLPYYLTERKIALDAASHK